VTAIEFLNTLNAEMRAKVDEILRSSHIHIETCNIVGDTIYVYGQVQSATDPDTIYEVDVTRRACPVPTMYNLFQFSTCGCPAQKPCKHIFALTARALAMYQTTVSKATQVRELIKRQEAERDEMQKRHDAELAKLLK
jgi:hypothetical protein